MRYCLIAGLVMGCSWTPSTPPDVFIVSVDTLRVDHIASYNSSSPAATPNIDGLAEDGVRFTQAFSPVSVTGPAFCSVMTGMEVSGHGVFTNLFRGGTSLAPEHTTLAERFYSAGYRTGAFVSAFTLRNALGLDQGFSVYNGGTNKNRDGDMTADTMNRWLRVQEGPVFSWFHSFDPHGPLARMLEPEDMAVEWEMRPDQWERIPMYQRIEGVSQHDLYERLYARGVERADRAVGRLIDGLKSTDRYDDALIVFLADHGEGFRERGLWYDHGTSAHVEQTHVPLIIKYPKNRLAGSVDGRLVSLVDVAPTIIDVASLAPLEHADGRSLKSKEAVRTLSISESSHCKRISVLDCSPAGGRGKELAVRSLSHTLVSRSEESGEVEWLYDRQTDAEELSPVDRGGVLAHDTHMNMLRTDRRTRTYDPLPGLDVDDQENRNLRALGYVE